MDYTVTREWLAAEFRAQIGRMNLSRREVARRIDIDHVTLARRLLGTTSFTVEEFIAMCSVLELSAMDVLGQATTAGLWPDKVKSST